MKQIMKKMAALGLAATMAGCSVGGSAASTGSSATSTKDNSELLIGVIQLAPHPALDAATQGFV